MKISIQGLDGDAYREFSQVEIDFDAFVENIRYFYAHRGQTKLYLKIMDVALKGRPEQDFYDLFGGCCDDISVEHLMPASSKIDYEKRFGKKMTLTVNGRTAIQDAQVCPRPFFAMNIHSDGEADLCCSANMPGTVGNVFGHSIVDVWNSAAAQAFRRMQLTDRTKNPVCAACEQFRYVMYPEDVLDDAREQLMEKF